jgi:hypothetical protein
MFTVLCLAPLWVRAQATNSSYSVTHTYWFQVPNGLPPISFFNYRLGAAAFEPLPGWDVAARNGQWAILGGGAFADTVRAGTDRPRFGFTDAGATAGVNANVLNWGGGNWRASMRSWGNAHAQFIPDMAFANSAMNTQIWASSWRNGRIIWTPVINDLVGGSAWAVGNRWRPIRNRDPIHFTGLDAAGGEMWTESFFDIFLELSSPVDWDASGLRVNDPNGPVDMTLALDMTNPFMTSPGGQLKLDIQNGEVMTSMGTGIFASLPLPMVGSMLGSTLTLPLSNEFTIDYDLTGKPSPDLLITLDGGGDGIIPEPAMLAVVGLTGSLLLRRRAA